MSDHPVPTDHEISERAFRIWLDEGKPDGMAEAHWHRARELLAARDAFSAPEAAKPARVRKPKAATEKPAAPRKSRAKAAE